MTHPLLEGSPYRAYTYSYPHKTAHGPLEPARPLRQVWAEQDRSALFLYLHVPFCEMRCGFCNLFTTTGGEGMFEAYLTQLERHADVASDFLDGDHHFARLAIGGGTPTLLGPHGMTRLLNVARRMGLDVAATPSSVETSPKTANIEVLSVLADAGVRRLSIGVQAFDRVATRALGRPQDEREVEQALETIRAMDFPTFNIDLMYGAEGQDVRDWIATVERALSFDPDELFLYPLYVRPLTHLGKKGATAGLDARLIAYREARDLLRARGFRQVSMRLFRRADAASEGPTYRCQEDGMLGLGCGARSYTEHLHYSWPYAVERGPIRDVIADYLTRSDADLAHAHHGVALDRQERARRFVLLSLLHEEGLDLGRFEARFGVDCRVLFPELSELPTLGLVQPSHARWVLTDAGMERSDAIGPWLYSSATRARMEAWAWR